MNGTTAYALSKAYTDMTAQQFGAVKGSPCTVAGTSTDADGNTIIKLQWKNDTGAVKTTDVRISKGEDGSSIKTIEIDEDNHLIVTLTDDSVIDAGSLGSGGVLSEDLIATTEIGSVKAGKKYEKGTPLEAILRDILIKVEAPSVSLSFNPTKTVYNVVSETIPLITLKASVTKKTYAVKVVRFYAGTELLANKEISDTGSVSYEYAPSTPINKTTTFKVEVEDVEGNKNSTSSIISFVGPSYYGFVEPTVTTPTEAEIKALNKTLKTTKGYVYKNIVCDYNKVVYAYPKDMGALTSIRDEVNNLNYTASMRQDEVTVDGIDYYVYTQINAAAASNVELTYK